MTDAHIETPSLLMARKASNADSSARDGEMLPLSAGEGATGTGLVITATGAAAVAGIVDVDDDADTVAAVCV